MTFATVMALFRLKVRIELFVTAPLPSAPAAVPPAVGPPTCRVPPLIVVVVEPLVLLVMNTVSVPTLVRPKAPAMPPSRLMSPALLPTVAAAVRVTWPASVAAATPLLVSAAIWRFAASPFPAMLTASAPTAWPLRSSVAPATTVVPPTVVPSAVALPSFKVPAFTVVAPP